MMLASIFGVHPVISSTVFLAVFTSGHTDVHPALLMQAHLIGWGAGTMSSVASLSVIMGASLFLEALARFGFRCKFVRSIFLCTGWWHCIELYQHNDL